jgi:hypothetical protein
MPGMNASRMHQAGAEMPNRALRASTMPEVDMRQAAGGARKAASGMLLASARLEP